MWNCRLGAVPVVEVKIPQPVGKAEQPAPVLTWKVAWSSQNGKMVKSWPPHGRQVEPNWEAKVTNWAVPLESAETLLKVSAYNVTGNGRLIVVTQSSQLLPILVVPGTIGSVPAVMAY